jgi:penicillin-binding protein 2
MALFRRSTKSPVREITPEEILLDAHNLPAYNAGRLEGRLNKPISTKALFPLVLLLGLSGVATLVRTGQLMALESHEYVALSESNRLGHTRIIPERGVVYDRNGVELIWNVPHTTDDGVREAYHERAYLAQSGVSHVLGYVRMPARDMRGNMYREGIEGVAGVELAYDEVLRGTEGVKIVETDARMDVVSEGVLQKPVPGKPVRLTIDARLQEAMQRFIREHAERTPFLGGAGVMMDVQTGEIVALTSYPEYEPSALVSGDDEKIAAYASDERTPYLNRVVAISSFVRLVSQCRRRRCCLLTDCVDSETGFCQ